MPTGSSFEHIHSNSDYRRPHETSSSSAAQRSIQTAEYIGSDRECCSSSSSQPNKSLILSKFFNGSKAALFGSSPYENLCSGCGYGVFEGHGKLCNFCRYVVLNEPSYLEDNNSNNIYENICDKCSGLYGSGSECAFCSSKNNNGQDNDNENENDHNDESDRLYASNNKKIKKSSSKKSKKRFFNSLLGSLKRVKSFNVPAAGGEKSSPPHPPQTNRKLEIVHNVDGYDNVFRTNETFDLNRICELKQLKSSTSDHHIYGKIRKINGDDDDDHLRSPYECVKQKSQSDDYLISGTGCEQFFQFRCNSSVSTFSHNQNYTDEDDSSISSARQPAEVRSSVGEWMTSVRCETHDYYSFGAPDTVLCNPKSIPANFGIGTAADELRSWPAATFGRSQVVTLRACSDEGEAVEFEQQMVNEFKRSLMEKHVRSKRQGIYLKLDDVDVDNDVDVDVNVNSSIESKQRNYDGGKVVGDDRDHNCLSPSSTSTSAHARAAQAGPDSSRRGAAHQLSSKRCCIYEKDSEFVSDILQVFDSFLHRDSEATVVRDVDDDNAEVQSEPVSREVCRPSPVKQSDSIAPPAGVDIEKIIQQLTLSSGLNRIVLTYDVPLRVFLSGVDRLPHLSHLSFPRLAKHFRRFQVFLSRRECIADVDTPKMTVPHSTPPISRVEDEEEEPIYQPIWNFKTVGEVRETYVADDHYCDSAAPMPGVDIEDHDEWEPDDEFTFTTKLDADTISVNTTQSSGSTVTGYASSVSTMTIASTTSVQHHIFRNICIFYSPKEPKLRAVLYDYDRNRCSSYFAQQPPPAAAKRPPGRGANDSLPAVPAKQSESGGGRMFADSVQAWKYMLLDVNYLEDEEDMYVSENQIISAQTIKEMEPKPPMELQKFKSQSSGDLTQEEGKKSITEKMRNKFQRGVFKLPTRTKENKKGRYTPKRNETASVYSEEGLKPKYPIFQAPLEQLEMDETCHPDVPRFVVDCVEYIEAKDVIQMDGLYRASGNKVAIDDLKHKLTESFVYDKKLLITDDIHTLTSLLKQFFRELPSPLIPQNIYQRIAATRNLMDPAALEVIKPAILEMKNPNRATLQFLIKHLTVVAHYSCENRMPASNLAIVWGPCILSANQIEYDIAKMNTLAKVLIENYDRIFGDNERLVS